MDTNKRASRSGVYLYADGQHAEIVPPEVKIAPSTRAEEADSAMAARSRQTGCAEWRREIDFSTMYNEKQIQRYFE